MNYRELVNRLEEIENRIDEADPARAQYDKFKADDARSAAIEKVKALMAIPLNDIPRLGDAIDPKTGIIYYGEAGQDAFKGSAKPYPYKWLADPKSTSDQSRKMYSILTPAGLKVIPVEKKSLFGSYQVAGISPQQLADLDKPVEAEKDKPVEPGKDKPGATTLSPSDLAALMEKLKKLGELVDQYAAKKKAKQEGFGLAEQLKESFGYIPEGDLVHAAGAGATGYAAGKLASKIAGRAIPGVSIGLDAYDAYDRWKEGDYTGAALSGAGAALGWIPGIGQAASLGALGINAGRDIKAGKYDALGKTVKDAVTPAKAPPMKPGGDPVVYELQKKLAAKGATNSDGTPLVPDGYKGKSTLVAMQKFPNVKEGV
jgi:hypothetical protein